MDVDKENGGVVEISGTVGGVSGGTVGIYSGADLDINGAVRFFVNDEDIPENVPCLLQVIL